MSKQAFASLDPDGFSQGGGLFDDVDATVVEAKFSNEPPEGYNAEGNPLFFVLGLQIDGADGPVEQRYSMGGKAGDNFTVSEDGLGLIPEGPASKINANSKFGMFMKWLRDVQFPVASLSGDGNLGNLVGLRAHFNRMADPERKGLQTGNQKKKQYPETTLVVTKIHSLPGETKGARKTTAAPKAGAKASAAKAAPAVNEADIEAAEEALMAILTEKGGTVQKSQLPLLAVRALNGNPRKAEIGKVIYNDDFLARQTAWAFDPSSNPVVITLN